MKCIKLPDFFYCGGGGGYKRHQFLKECFTTVKQVFFSYTTEWYLVDTPAYKPFTLVGPPVLRP